MKPLPTTVSGPSMIDPSHDNAPRPHTDALPEAPREGFELGAIDVSSERPSHGLAADRSTRWLVGGLVGGSLVLAGLITLIRGPDDATPSGDRIELQAGLGDPLRSSVLALEAVRLEAITISTVRALADEPVPTTKGAARKRTDDGATPAATMPASSSRNEPARGTAAPTIGELPPPPPEPEPTREDASATPPPSPAPAESPPTVDAPEPDEASDAPSGV